MRLALEGFDVATVALPHVRLGDQAVRAAFASSTSVAFIVPPDATWGHVPVRLDAVPGQTVFLDVGTPVATGVHQVDSPVVDAAGTIYATCSGSRGQQSSVSIYRIGPDGVRDVFVTGLTNATFALARAGLRERHPGASDHELFLRLAILTLGSDLAGRAYPDARSLRDA